MGDSIVCTVVIIEETLAKDHTLTNLEMYLKDTGGNKVTINYVEY